MHRRAAGFSLIEVLVSMLVLGIGILGMAALQLNSMKFNQTAAVRTQATFLAYDMSDRLRANRADARGGSYDTDLDDAAPAGANITATDLRQWKAALGTQLPAGAGAIERSGNVISITVQWSEGRIGESETQQFVFETQL
ncbi:type IV pilus modification protein PilV [Stutzerimonas stutzeri]|nr:type IV pilus modification protein PilV [Stutzerimonas stutzeri]